jgi:hypothetical protein
MALSSAWIALVSTEVSSYDLQDLSRGQDIVMGNAVELTLC